MMYGLMSKEVVIRELYQHKQRREDSLHEQNSEILVPSIIPFNPKYNDIPPVGAPFYDDESDNDSSVGLLLSESEVNIDAGNVSYDFSDTPATPTPQYSSLEGYQSIPDIQREHCPNQYLQPTPRDTSPEGYNTPEVIPKHIPGQRKQRPKYIWERHDGKIQCVALNKFNCEVRAITFIPHQMHV